MATITTDTYLDGGTARTAGETWTCNGGVLTVRTDTRVHANAPAGMTGSLGSQTISATLGGGVIVDSSNVRWMEYDSGAGVVPAIGTTITQGGVSGYLLGVWSSYTSAPTAVGAAMPATGYLKFREVTGGPYSAGALTGITANATSADVTGWLEVVCDVATTVTVPRLGSYEVNHDGTARWFDLGVTTGAAMSVQLPTNGGGVGTHCPALWIETSPGSGVYEKYEAAPIAYFTTTNFGTDVRNKYCYTAGDGLMRLGSDGVSSIGYVPPAGCNIRVPNVFLRQCDTATRATNAEPHATIASRPEFATTQGGVVKLNGVVSDWFLNFSTPNELRLTNSAFFDAINIISPASPLYIDDVACSPYLGTTNYPWYLAYCFEGTTMFRDVSALRGNSVSAGNVVYFYSCFNFTGNIKVAVAAFARNVSCYNYFLMCKNLNIDMEITNTFTYLGSCLDCEFTFDYCDRHVGVTNATAPLYAIQPATKCSNIKIHDVTFGKYGVVNGVNPYYGIMASSTSVNIDLRDCGTFASPLNNQAGFEMSYIVADHGGNNGVKISRVWASNVRTGIIQSGQASSKNVQILNCGVGAGGTAILYNPANTSYLRGVRATTSPTAGASSIYGTHWHDMFESDTAGRVILAFNEPTAETADQFEAVSLGVGANFTSVGSIVMPNMGDQIIWTMPYFCVGHTALANAAATLTGTNTGNFTYEYQIDTGTGWNGTWKTLNGANLSSETILPVTGFKLKYRITTATANASNALLYVRINTATTLIDQTTNLYPQDYATITLTGLTANSRVQLYDTTNSVELYNEVVTDTSLTYQVPYTADFTCRVRVMYQSGVTAKEFVEFTESVTIDGVSRAVTQTDDAVYNANAIDGSTITNITIDDGTLLVNVDTGTVSLQNIYAYETYWLYTEEGIRDESRFITAIDQANYIFEDFKIKNVQSSPDTLTITGGYMKDSLTEQAVDVIDLSGGTVFLAPEHVVPFETSGSSVTAADIWSYSSRRLSTAGNSDIIDPISTTVTSATASLATEETAQKTLKNTKVIIGEL